MDEKDRKIRELERELAEARREADRLRPEESRFRYTPDRVPPVPGPYWYDQRPAPPPRAKPGRIALIIVGCLAVLAVVAAALVFFAFTMLNSVDRETTALSEELLQAVAEQDGDRAYALFYPGALSREEFDQGFAELCAVWREGNGGGTFTLKRTSYSMNTRGGVTYCASVYRVSSGEARFFLEVDRKAMGETTGLVSARLSR